ncbi:MAG: beta-galactosidase small subunit [Desulfomicrobium escambiense]|nr:beta-galactosidase small subunit [Desulfomicrobium escambiense]
MAFRDAEGRGLLVLGDPVLEFSAHPHWPEDLTQESRGSKHPPDVTRPRLRLPDPRPRPDGGRRRRFLGGPGPPRIHPAGQGLRLHLRPPAARARRRSRGRGQAEPLRRAGGTNPARREYSLMGLKLAI